MKFICFKVAPILKMDLQGIQIDVTTNLITDHIENLDRQVITTSALY